MDTLKVSAAFNRWMDDYTKNPEAFEATHKSAMRHLNEKLEGKQPSYRDECAAILAEYMGQL